MEIHDEKNHLYNIIIFFSMLLFAVCLTMNVIFGSNYYPYESLDNTIIYKTWTISNNITVNEDSDNVTYSKSLFLNNNNSYTETIIKNICKTLFIKIINLIIQWIQSEIINQTMSKEFIQKDFLISFMLILNNYYIKSIVYFKCFFISP